MTSDEIKQKIIDYANGYGINPNIALAQARRESGFDPNQVGADGEHGLMQILPATWNRFSNGVSFDNAFDVDYNLTVWGNYMTYLSGLFGGDMTKVLTAYNGGEGHLTNPGKYGPPSAAAIAYGQQLAAYGGSPSLDQASSAVSGFPIWLLIGAGVFIAVLVLKD